jgi:bacterioferritin (cytochrome b1)
MFLILLLLNNAFAGDEMKAGDRLKYDSYVLSIEEANKLKKRIIELEKKEELLTQYEKLNTLRKEQNEILTFNLSLKDNQISSYKNIIKEYEEIENIKNKKEVNKFIKNGSLILSGVLFMGLSVYAADKFDDSLEK